MFVPQPRSDRWYAVYTLPHPDHIAQMHLKDQGFRTFAIAIRNNPARPPTSTVLAPLLHDISLLRST
jgi:hypothetical protein